MALARCAGNRLIYWLMDMLHREVSHAGWRASSALPGDPEEIEHHLDEHRAIADAIRAGDGERASRLMEQHLNGVRVAMMGQRTFRPEPAAGRYGPAPAPRTAEPAATV